MTRTNESKTQLPPRSHAEAGMRMAKIIKAHGFETATTEGVMLPEPYPHLLALGIAKSRYFGNVSAAHRYLYATLTIDDNTLIVRTHGAQMLRQVIAIAEEVKIVFELLTLKIVSGESTAVRATLGPVASDYTDVEKIYEHQDSMGG